MSVLSTTHRVLLAVAVLALLAAPTVQAQQSACVYNQPGGGFVAKMRVCGGNSCTGWSSGFAIGKTQCQGLSSYANGASIKVEVDAVAGKQVTCTPTFTRDANFNGTAVFHTWGTTLSPKCEQPGGATKGQACVYLEPGAGYAAEMQTCPPNVACGDASCAKLSSSFPIGKTSCQPLSATPAGQNANVCVHAVAGKTVSCQPTVAYDPNYGLNVVYHAFGTTAQPACQVPQ